MLLYLKDSAFLTFYCTTIYAHIYVTSVDQRRSTDIKTYREICDYTSALLEKLYFLAPGYSQYIYKKKDALYKLTNSEALSILL